MAERPKWYVVHTYSGYENKVKVNLEKTVENRNLHELVHDVQVPMEEQVEIKDGKKKTCLKKIFPGYVLVKMILSDESWYVVRNTRGVTGFVGPGSKPVALTDEEAINMRIVDKIVQVDVEIGENVKVIVSPFDGFVATVKEINTEKHKVKVLVNMFGRETPVELDFNQIEKMD